MTRELPAVIRVTVDSRTGRRLDQFERRLVLPAESLVSRHPGEPGYVGAEIRWQGRNYPAAFGPIDPAVFVEGALATVDLTIVAEPRSYEETEHAERTVSFSDGRQAAVSERPTVKAVY